MLLMAEKTVAVDFMKAVFAFALRRLCLQALFLPVVTFDYLTAPGAKKRRVDVTD